MLPAQALVIPLFIDQGKYTLPIYVQYFFGRGSADWEGSWPPQRSTRSRSDSTAAGADGTPAETGTAAEILAIAANRSLVLVVRDTHRSASTQDLVTAVLADRPDTVLVEMGLPVWQPPAGSSGAYVTTYGASRANGQAAAEVLSLTSR